MFGISDFGAFCAAILVFLALPGPGTLALLTATGKSGFRGGAAATFGVIVGDQVLLWLAVAGVAALLAARPVLFQALQYAGAVYLGWVGLRLVLGRKRAAAPEPAEPPPDTPTQAAKQGAALQHAKQAFLITLLNPKAIVFYMAFFPLFIDPVTHRGLPTFAAMALTIALITAAYCLALCAGADLIAARIRAHRAVVRWLERIAGLLLIGFGLRLVRN